MVALANFTAIAERELARWETLGIVSALLALLSDADLAFGAARAVVVTVGV